MLRTTQAEYEKNGSEERTGGRRLATYWAGFARTLFAEGRRSGLREGMRGEWRIEDEIFGKRIEELPGLGVGYLYHSRVDEQKPPYRDESNGR